MSIVYTFWEGKMPDYIKMCMNTWQFPYVLLNYENLHKYTDLPVDDRLKRFTLPQIADVVRVHVLRDNGGYWLDTDTIILEDKLPLENMVGDVEKRTNTIGFLHTEKNSNMFRMWAKYQDDIIKLPYTPMHWAIMGNLFTDTYVQCHEDITIYPVDNCWAETYLIKGDMSRRAKYETLYFHSNCKLVDFNKTPMLMLHNSWTPDWYKLMCAEELLQQKCTLANILREVTK